MKLRRELSSKLKIKRTKTGDLAYIYLQAFIEKGLEKTH
jgi:hypothetical protein